MQNTNRMKVICIIADALAILYGGLYFFWMVFAAGACDDRLVYFFGTFNPMTYGSYFLGAVLVFHCYVYKNKWGRLALWILYMFSALVSLVAVMGLTVWSDLLMYVPHLVIVPAAVIVMYKRRKRT